MENLPTPARKQPAFRRPAIKLDGSQKSSDNSSSDAPDGAIFRQPMAPIQMTISPGNAADGAKLAEKLKKLELSRKKTARSHPIDLKTPSKVDLVATERFFVESSVENVAQTPRTQSFREPLRTPARFLQEAMDPRDSMRSNATYVLNTPRMDRAQHPNSDPFTPALVTPSRRPATASATATTPLAYEEKLERQFVALSSWANVILDSASFVSEIDLGTSKQDASLKLQEMLTKPPKKNGGTVNGEVKRKYTDLCLRKKCLDYLKRADSVYQSTHEIIGALKTMVEKGQISIKSDVEVYANIGVQTSILSLLFSLHPFWLFIGVETVCAEFNDHDTASLDARLPFSSSSFAPATVRFIHEHILANANLMAKKKFAIGTVKKIVTPKGRDMLHKHCLNCILSMAVLLEYAKNSYLFENTPGLFVKNSDIKTVSDFSTELSRLVLSASGTPLNKAFDKCKFNRVYRQSFLEEYQYVMKTTRDMSDGIILGRLIELLTDSQPLKIIGNMRNPQGDRIRKKGNVEKALSAAAEADIDVDGISIDQILSAHRESCLDLMWRLVGVYVKKKAEQEPLRRESLCLEGTTDGEDADDTVMGAPLGGIADSAFTVYQQLAFQFGRHLSKWADLEDGLLLSSIWQYYNSSAPDIRFYDGETLFDKVAHAAESDLGIPLVLTSLRDERQLGLFAHMFLSRLISYKRLRDSEMSDAESDASSIVSIIRKEGANLTEETERIQRVRMESEREVSAKEEEERLKREAEKKREEELRMRFEEEEEERLSSEWRSPSRGIESIELEEKMLMEDGEAERIEEEMRRAQLIMEEERRLEEERVKKEEDERLAEEQRMREKEEEERRRMEEEEMERVKREKEEEERIRREEEVRLEEERLRKEEEEKERLRMIEETRVLAEEEERLKREEETRLEMERIQREEEDRRIEEARLKAEEEERLRREEEERLRLIEEARLLAEEEERMRREEEERVRKEEEERLRKEEEERLTLIEEARLRAVEEERLRREKEEEEKRERAAITIQCWTRGVYAVRLLKALKEERDERMKREEEEKRQKAGERIASWIYDRMTIRVAKKELEERRMNRAVEMEIERLRVEEEERRRKQAVLTIESWYSSALSIRAARSLLQMMREERWKREEEIRLEMERLRREEEERVRREEEERMRREEEARLEMERIRMEEEERLKREEEERLRRDEEARLEMERLVREEEERRRREEEERMLREEEARIEKERIEREEEEKRLRDEEEARVEMERLWNEEQERKMREEKEARLEQERLLREEQERLRREEEARVEMERLRKEEERRREEEELKIWAAKLAHEREERLYQEMLAKQEEDRRAEEMRQDRAARTIQSTVRPWLHKKRMEKRTMDLLREMTETSRLGRSERMVMTIGGMSDVSDDTLVAGVREIKRRQRKLSLTLSLTRQNRISDRQAAIRIQAWWRGIVVRHIHRKKIESMRVKMREFKDTAEKAMGVDNAERTVPVSKRLMRAKEYLTNGRSMYELKVACYTTMSLCRLTSLYCERAIVLDLHHLIINNFLIQADRSPAYEEIIEFGVQALEEMVKCKSARVRIEMVSVGVDLSKLAAHQMNAFPHHPVIPVIAMTILRMCKEILPVKTHAVAFEKINSYYLKQGEKRFVKLPLSDERHTAFVHLKNAFTE